MRIKDLKKRIEKAIAILCETAVDSEGATGGIDALEGVLSLINGKEPGESYWVDEKEVIYQAITKGLPIAIEAADLYLSVNISRGLDYKTKPVKDWTALNFTMYVKDRVKGSVVFDTSKLKSIKLPRDIIKIHGKVLYKEFVDSLLDDELVESFEIFSSKKAWQIFYKKREKAEEETPLETTLDKKSHKKIMQELDEGGFF